jgi:hypothetical protein
MLQIDAARLKIVVDDKSCERPVVAAHCETGYPGGALKRREHVDMRHSEHILVVSSIASRIRRIKRKGFAVKVGRLRDMSLKSEDRPEKREIRRIRALIRID